MKFGICLATVCLLTLSACATGLAPGAYQSHIAKKSPYELVVNLTVDGKPFTIDRVGDCSYRVTKMGPNPMDSRSHGWESDRWEDDLFGAVAVITSSGEAAIVEIPDVCEEHGKPGPINDSAAGPQLANLSNYKPEVIWIKDIAHIDRFEVYPSLVEAAPTALLHVRITNMVVEGPIHNLALGTPEEVAVAARFGSYRSDGYVGPHECYFAHSAYVRPKFWGSDPLLMDYFVHQKQIVTIPPGIGPKFKDADPNMRLIAKHLWELQAHWPSAAAYEVPMVNESGTWVLDPMQRGIRTYYLTKMSPYCRSDVPLTYKGHELHPGDGALYDPDSQTLIWVAYLLELK